ncbi:hypothetical protein RclHR1_05270003 [Rhizophagus clarus]|uniref:Uncharacterized protein n=1 Tax=Rhizophagus clarus TaxID=94130 RepID=A0A2Z6RMK2_9GLOM|nr:hypothetical protein RclHR1_05270003 [Rhizophagus clarus]GES79468.1 hypothetical protein GLOIN_2v1555961 [Rhizophagus clarus]
MKFFLLTTLTFFALILCIASLPQTPDFGVSPTIFVKLSGTADRDKEPTIQIFPLNSDLKVKWTSVGIKDNPAVLIQVYYIYPTLPKPIYLPILKKPKETYLNENSFTLKLDSNLFEANEKFYKVTISLKDDEEVVGTSKSFGVCNKCK